MNDVTGAVTSGGKPVPDVQVVFVGTTGETAVATTDTSGAYKLSAPPGKYQVSVTLPPDPANIPDSANPMAMPKLPFPQKYSAAGSSGLTYDVTDSGANTYDLKLD
ncbi:MAG TPA: carboxypeptidase-like regulatory domain-containing protein [Pirellulaceae bacterium]|jgi:hypothetical protein|nr:carboxypeptidase-like regulatory domain-containing protein [Pirellulaceae bacterium]